MSEVNKDRRSGLEARDSGLGARDSGLGARGSGLGARGSDDLLAEIDNELRSTLAIEPSPDFEARVLRTIDGRIAPRSWWMPSYAFVAAAAAIVLAVTVTIVMVQRGDDAAPMHASRAGSDVELPTRSVPDVSRHAGHVSNPTVVAQPFRAARLNAPRAPRREPEIIVPMNQLEALRRLVVAIDEGRVALADVPDGPVQPPAELIVAPIVVEPLLPPIEAEAKESAPEIRRLQ